MNKRIISLFFSSLMLSYVVNALEEPAELLKKDYSTFVKLLGDNIKDPKFLAALRAGDKYKDRVEFELDAAYPVDELIPTQNEIDVEKSLKYPLSKEDPAVLIGYLKAKNIDKFAPGGPIITSGGKYIIDGHHRWSQLFLINPKAKIKAINMKITQPLDALKFTQMAIASIAEQLPVSLVTGKNLLTMNKTDFNLWVKENISQSSIDAFKKAGIDGLDKIVDYIWSNATLMQKNNAPIKDAPNRGLMPQTDKANGWLESLQEGRIDIK
jgi:hypothetical protein